ncbi:MAG: hypothetical protein KZQ87_17445 [Candidatus Thiodiazotropha sp. (ex Cardiolucina cf. quadrata)]|nr:hypothetical protein [Candidatus Thiodiazotropha sp. (ex Cardiolucina cf. quadrata)]
MMKSKTEVKKGCNIKKSAFNYSLVVKPDGRIKIKDDHGKTINTRGRKSLPPIKKVVNTRTLTIMEAKGSQWIYLDPPGLWYPLS